MKKFILILIASIGISFYLSAQTVGDYRSVGNGNWNDASKWERYSGASWEIANSYPGQHPGTGAVTISRSNEIRITGSPAYPISSLLVDIRVEVSENPEFLGCSSADQFGALIFSSENAVSLHVSGYISIDGDLKIENQNGAKTHVLTTGGGLSAGTALYNCDFGSYAVGAFETVSQDDYLKVVFNTTWPGSSIYAPAGISFYDITFNGSGIILNTPVQIYGIATFTNGIVTADGYPGKSEPDGWNWLPAMDGGYITLKNGSTVYDASNASFVDGVIVKEGNSAFTFPIGNDGIYAPLTISAPVGPQPIYVARYGRSDPASFGPITDPGLVEISHCEYWLLYSLNGSSASLDVTVNYSSANGCASSPYIADVSGVKLARFSNSWDSHGGSGTGTTSNGSVTWSGLTSLGYFTLGNVNTSCHPPSALTTTNIGTNSAMISWSAVAGAASYDVFYRAATSGTWINAATATTSTSLQLSGLSSLVSYFWQVRSNCGSASSSYRQTQLATISDCGTPSGLSATNIAITSVTLSWNAVSDAVNYDVEYKESYRTGWRIAVIGTSSTTHNLTGLLPTTTYYWRVRAHCSSMPSAYIQAQFHTLNPCATPSGLVVTNITSFSATLSWNAVPNANQYNVQYKQATSSEWISAISGLGVPTYQINGLSASTAYDWRVGAYCYYSNNYTNYGSAHATSSFTTTATTIVCNDIFEPNNTASQAKSITVGTTIAAAISSATDIDWFKVTMPNISNTILQVTLSNLPADYDLFVYDKNLRLLGLSTATGLTNEMVIHNALARKSVYYLKVLSKNGANSLYQCYNLLAQAVANPGSVTRTSDPAKEVTDDPNKQLLYPNPASNFIYLNFNSVTEGMVNIQIVNSIGQLIKQQAVNIINGHNQFKLHVNDIRPGMYILKINKGDLNITRKFVIAR